MIRISPYEVEAGEFYDNILFIGAKSGGIKKKYAGITGGETVIKGLEAVKRNYSVLARDVQVTVLGMLLGGKSVQDCEKYLYEMKLKLISGKLNKQLVITTGVKQLDSYDKDRKLPPHARALAIASGLGCKNLLDISYVWGKKDVVPILSPEDLDKADIDYAQYYTKQVRARSRSFIALRADRCGNVGRAEQKDETDQ